MDNADHRKLRFQLRQRLSRFLRESSGQKAVRAETVQRIVREGWDACIFGGLVRDVLFSTLCGQAARPRDIDIVVAGVKASELERVFRGSVVRRTRFGGLRLCVQGWYFDVWPLHETWAFAQLGWIPKGIQDLPKTTFLTVESVVVQLGASNGRGRRIYEHRFFESMLSRVVELNLKENPYPALNAVRALVAARKLQFGIGPQLAAHIDAVWQQHGTQALYNSHRDHYRHAMVDTAELQLYLKAIRKHLEYNASLPVYLPGQRQLDFAWDLPQPIGSAVADALNHPEAEVVSVA